MMKLGGAKQKDRAHLDLLQQNRFRAISAPPLATQPPAEEGELTSLKITITPAPPELAPHTGGPVVSLQPAAANFDHVALPPKAHRTTVPATVQNHFFDEVIGPMQAAQGRRGLHAHQQLALLAQTVNAKLSSGQSAQSWYEAGIVQAMLGRFDKAEQALLESLERALDTMLAVLSGPHASRMRDACLEQVMHIRRMLAEVCMLKGDHAGAIQHAYKALHEAMTVPGLGSDLAQFRVTLARAHLAAEDPNEALEALVGDAGTMQEKEAKGVGRCWTTYYLIMSRLGAEVLKNKGANQRILAAANARPVTSYAKLAELCAELGLADCAIKAIHNGMDAASIAEQWNLPFLPFVQAGMDPAHRLCTVASMSRTPADCNSIRVHTPPRSPSASLPAEAQRDDEAGFTALMDHIKFRDPVTASLWQIQ